MWFLFQKQNQVVETNEELRNKLPVLSFQAWSSNPIQTPMRRSIQESAVDTKEPKRKGRKNKKKVKEKKDKNETSYGLEVTKSEHNENLSSPMELSLTESIASLDEPANGRTNPRRKSYRKQLESPTVTETDSNTLQDVGGPHEADVRGLPSTQISGNGEIVFLHHTESINQKYHALKKGNKLRAKALDCSVEKNIGCLEAVESVPNHRPTSIGPTSYLAYLYSKMHLRNKVARSNNSEVNAD